MPPQALREKQHPAKRCFQAIRIEVNEELAAVEEAAQEAVRRLKTGGRLCAITFHSLEDRLIKRLIADKASGCACPPEFPVCICGKKPAVRQITKKPITASETEISENPRARSAKLRIAEKI